MDAQLLTVALLVGGSGGYVVWTLLPQAARRGLARGLLCWPLPRALAQPLRRVARVSAGCCNCSGCDRAPAIDALAGKAGQPTVAGTQALVFHPRRRA